MSTTQSEIALANLVEERELIRNQHEAKLAEIASRDDKSATHTDKELLRGLRERAEDKDREISDLTAHIEREAASVEESKRVRRILAGSKGGFEVDGDEVAYRDFYTYARDVVLSRTSLGSKYADDSELAAMSARLQLLKRTPANTLSSNVEGLQPDQHIAQIFQVIDTSRPLVASAVRTTLDRGTLTYPSVTTSPVVAVQGTEKTEAGNTGMVVDMETSTASTYLGGGDLSWQAINWSTPDALRLWFDLAAADYALKTEQDAAQALQHSAFTYNIASTIGGTPSFADFLTAVGAGGAEVFANSGRLANTIYMSIDRYWYLFGLTSTAMAQFTSVNIDGIGRLSVVASRGMDSGVIAVGDSSGLLVAETAGAPVELRVVEPAIGGVEVGIIGAFEAVVVDPGAFAMITTAS